MIEKFTSELRVDKNIVPLLSKSTYQRSFSDAIRELISNSYDADALTVRISVSKDFKKISIEDDGNGMTKKDFDRYPTIARKKSEGDFTKKYKRKRIGQFGIGFLAIFPYCGELEIVSTIENSEEILTAKIPTANFFQLNVNNEFEIDTPVDEIKVFGNIVRNPNERLKHYTRINLLKPTYSLQNYFSQIDTRKRSSILNWEPFDRFKWELQEELPIKFEDENTVTKFINYEEPIGINVFINNNPIYRNPLGKYILSQGSGATDKFNYKYIITTNYKSMQPLEARGLKIRVNNIGIGPRTDFSLKRDRGFSRLHWINGEIHISENIKENLNLNRNGFISDPIIDSLIEALADILRKQATKVEKISEAEKELNDIFNNSKTSLVKPKTEIITTNLGKLANTGFKLVTKKDAVKPFEIDKENKVVYVGNIDKLQEEKFSVFNRNYVVKYSKWNLNDENPACRLSNNTIEINVNYPLFASKTYGNLFKKIISILLIAKNENRTSESMYAAIIENLINEFQDYT